MKLLKLRVFFLITTSLFFISPLFAYNFLYTKDSGEPLKWDNTQPIRYYLDPDPGPYQGFTFDQVHILLQEAMKLWENVPTAKAPRFEFAGYLPEDVNIDNYDKYVSISKCFTETIESCEVEAQRNLQTVIIFDEEILDNVLCRILSCSAKAGPSTFEGGLQPGDFKRIVQGYAVFGAPPSGTAEIVAWFAHELGHLLGLAHPSLDQQISYYVNEEDPIDVLFYLPTMMDSDNGSMGTTLNPDDMAGISVLYPSDAFFQDTAIIKGTITKADGSPMPEVNVVARNIEDPLCKAYSFLTSRFCPHPLISLSWTCLEANGNYEISGLPPGDYTIEVEEIVDEDIAYGTGVLNAYLAGDAEFWNEGDQASEDSYAYTVISLAAGETRENVDIILNRSEVTEDRVKFIPLDVILANFPLPETTACTDTTIDYAGLIGIDEGGDDAASAGGCSLVIRK